MVFSDDGTYAGDDHGKQFTNNSLSARKAQYDGGLPGPGGNTNSNGNVTPGTPGTPGIVRERRFYARYPNLWVRMRWVTFFLIPSFPTCDRRRSSN